MIFEFETKTTSQPTYRLENMNPIQLTKSKPVVQMSLHYQRESSHYDGTVS